MTVLMECDIAHDCPIGPFLETLERHVGTIKRFVAVGPGGGNPCVTMEFPSEAFARAWFLDGYAEDPDEFPLHLVKA